MIELSALVRFVHLAAAALLVGSHGFLVLIAQPAAKKAAGGVTHPILDAQRRFHFRTAWLCLVLLAVSALLALWLQLLNVAGPAALTDLSAVSPLLTDTQYGKVWLTRAALIILVGLALTRPGRPTNEHADFSAVAGLGLSAALLAAIALSGHAAAAEGARFAAQTFLDGCHLLAAGFWLGGLVPLFVSLRTGGRTSDPSALAMTAEVTRRFSLLGVISVSLLIVTGGYNAWTLVASFPALFGTPYGQLLLAKLGFLVPLLGVAAINHRRLLPGLVAGATDRPETVAGFAIRLKRNVIVELCLGTMILLIVGHMGVTPPARHAQPDWPFSFRWDWSALEKAPKARAEVERGLVWASVGAVALVVALARCRRRIVSAAIGLGAVGYAGYTVHSAVQIDAYPTTYKRPGVTYHAISVANGKFLYRESGCIACHGANGYGDGPAAQELDPRPADLTAPHANAHTAGDLFWWLSHGVKQTSAMPGYHQSLDEEERWDLINFMRALSSGERARNLAPVIDDRPWLVAPDFTYITHAGETKTLRDHRGEKIVWLMLLNMQSAEERLTDLAAVLPQLQSLGVEVIVVPDLIDDFHAADKFAGLVVSDGIHEITETYALFSRSFAEEKRWNAKPHVEFLIDKQGYIRARWLPAENQAWKKTEVLLRQVEALRNEKPRAPAPAEHVH